MKTVLAGAASVVAALALAVVLFAQSGAGAEAVVHGISATPSTTANAGDTIVLSIDADDGTDVTVVTTAGTFGPIVCTDNATLNPSVDCVLDAGDPSGDPTVGVGGNSSYIIDGTAGTDLITAELDCPSPGPAAPVVSAIQGNTVDTINLTCRGAVAELTLEPRLQWDESEITTKSTSYIESTSATTPTDPGVTRAVAANLRTTAKDSAGNTRGDVTIIYITSDGQLVDKDDFGTPKGFDTTDSGGATNGIANEVSLVHGTNGATGDVATVTANAAGKTASAELTFAGDAIACEVSAAESSVGSGGSTVVTAMFWSNSDKTVPVPDYHTILGGGSVTGDPDITAVNAVGAGTFAVTGQTPVVGGTSTATLTVGASGGTGVLATMGGTSVTCNTTVSVSTTVVPPTTPGGGTGDGSIAGTLPTSGFGLVTFGGTVDQLRTALATACPSGAPIFATSGGAFVGFFPTTTLEAPNAAFLALYGASGLPANTPLLGGNC